MSHDSRDSLDLDDLDPDDELDDDEVEFATGRFGWAPTARQSLLVYDDGEISTTRAILAGHLLVSGGVLAIVTLVILLGMLLTPLSPFPLAIAGAAVSWVWWSATVPLWWRWALARGADPYDLQDAAEATLLVWPRDSWLERTEFGDRWAGIDAPGPSPGAGPRAELLPAVESADSAVEGPLWAVTTEYGHADGTWTLVAFDDGSCAVHFDQAPLSALGPGASAEVDRAVGHLMATARQVSTRLPVLRDNRPAEVGEVALSLLHAEGARGARVRLADLRLGSEPATVEPSYDEVLDAARALDRAARDLLATVGSGGMS